MGIVYKPLRIGAGGWITGIDQANDGTKVIRTDTFGSYIWNDSTSQWDQLITQARMPAGYADLDSSDGCFEIAIAPSDSNRIYLTHLNRIFKSTDKGQTFSLLTGFSAVAMTANNQTSAGGIPFRVFGRKMVVDPADPDHVLFGSEANGLFRTTDGGENWSSIGSVATSTTAAGIILAFDQSAGTSGGRTQGVYASSAGNGVYYSSDGGATFSLTASTGRPTSHFHMACTTAGKLYLTEADTFNSTNNLKSYNGSAWATEGAGTRCCSIAIDPDDDDHVVISADSGAISVTVNGGTAWTGFDLDPDEMTREATDITWHEFTNEAYMSNGDTIFDRVVAGRLYFAMGIGVFYTTPPDAGTVDVVWTEQSIGIEQLIPNQVLCPPGKSPLFAVWDRQIFRSTDPDSFPSVHYPDNSFNHCWAMDWASSDPDYIAAVIKFGATENSSYSTDGGATWNDFAAKPDFQNAFDQLNSGGCIACSTPNNIVWFGSNNAGGYYTTNGGSSWTAMSFPGIDDPDPFGGEGGGTDTSGWGQAYYFKRHIVCADRVAANTFYAYNSLPIVGGTFKSTNGGADWTRVDDTVFSGSNVNAKMRSVPGQEGHLFFTSGQQGNRGDSNPAATLFYKSTDGGDTWSSIADVEEVYDFDFGPVAAGASYPSIIMVGFVSDEYGIWISDDAGDSWTQLGDYPLGWGDSVVAVGASKETHGLHYLGWGGSGFVYGQNAVGGGRVRFRMR